jgi:hypothetical protein
MRDWLESFFPLAVSEAVNLEKNPRPQIQLAGEHGLRESKVS